MGQKTPTKKKETRLADAISAALAEVADAEKAAPMAAYMKTEMPFYGVQKKERTAIWRQHKGDIELTTPASYKRAVLALWNRPHREEKYMALTVARHHRQHITLDALPLYERLVREGAWWDLVDEVATQLVGSLWQSHPTAVGQRADEWIDDDDMWIRRTAIIGQLKRKEATDHRRLFRYCRARADETEFFIRKAIGWALREYAKTRPDRVRAFVDKNRARLSGLSVREAEKGL